MYEIAFRCDASKFHKIGTGHLYRSLAIAEGLTKKYNLKKNKLIFICKRNKLDRKIKKIIKNKKFNVIFFKEKNEINFLKKLKVKNIIFDRILKENRKHIEIIKKKFHKVIYLESLNNNINECLRINSIIHKKNIRYSGFKFLITPLLNEKRNKLIENEKKIFINLGGINKILAYYRLNGVPDFGTSENESYHTPGVRTVNSSISFIKGLILIAKDVSPNKKIELPVAEEMQMGITLGLAMEGNTPISIFDKTKETNPNLINPGDTVVFKNITKDQFQNYYE
mgnify:CR=1 FL=1